MGLQFAALLALAALPVLLVLLHGLLVRLLKVVGADLGPQPMAIVIFLLLNAAIAAAMVACRGGIWLEGSIDGFYDAAYVALTANAMWFVYFQVFVNLSLTSLHARLMLYGLWNGSVQLQSMAKEYDGQTMLSARLNRLRKLRQITVDNGMISLAWPYLLWLSFPLYWWRRLIRVEGEQLNLAEAREP